MVRITKTVYAKEGTSSVGGMKYNKRPYKAGVSKSLTNPKQSMQVEKKNIDVNSATRVVAGSGTATTVFLNPVGQGTDDNQRIGRRIMMKSIQYRFVGSLAATTAGSSPIRLVIVYDKQTNTALPALTTQVFESDSIESPMNIDYSDRFIVICDEIVNSVGVNGDASFYVKGFRKINLPEEFLAGGATIGDVTKGSMIAYVFQTGALITANPDTQLYTRIRYTDV